ncbi:hypothetical protein KR51_00008900 [Rubidibacter lacunae KORDI 51-2]|uniref:Uncharacterized protein n=1 Tax=Rubidibacter lacunae KORDI 51-2 TaxID=582515 RepID=U5DL64_9CHRO|nr:hypothetical protein [Rubidibacter lacunae]ERN42426.1 hypothetical protein KR51_00008900 [Rubidibacter lacunae KORDI 51-2]
MIALNESHVRQLAQAQETLYQHLLECVMAEPPEQAIERYRKLFLGVDYPEPAVRDALEIAIGSHEARVEFGSLLNRCWYIAINQWQLQPQLRDNVPLLVDLLEHVRPPRAIQSRATRRLRQLLLDFRNTEQYQKLQRLARLNDDARGTVGNLLVRYPYLYDNCLLSEDSNREHKETIRRMRSQVQRRYELNLSQYVVRQVRLTQRARRPPLEDQPRSEPLTVPLNPTLLSDRALSRALRHFVGNIEGNYTYRDLALSFITHSSQAPSYREFKRDLYEYLTASVDPAYGQRMFNARLASKLEATLPHCDLQRPNEFLILRTSSQLLKFLIIDNRYSPDHFVFLDLVGNLGTTPTIGMLLKLTLLCRKSRPYLDKRFSVLFSHYETEAIEGLPWLVRSLENLHLALTIHFGSADLTTWRQIT